MAAIPKTNSNSILTNAYQGARNGAVKGALAGVSVVSATLAAVGGCNLLEIGNRAIGNEPKWPLFEGDCQLQQFRDLSVCTKPAFFDSFTFFATSVIGTTTVCGTVAGAVSGVAKSIFAKQHAK